jgi:uncharacterized protein (TIGR03086 family)
MRTRFGTADVTFPSDLEILITRRFAAPASLVWEALTLPRHVLRWWGPPWCPLVSADMDFRPGGAWRYVAVADEQELAWFGTYREIGPGHRFVTTETFSGFPDAATENTIWLTEEAGATTLRTLVRHTSTENRDGHAESMAAGMPATFDRLEDLLDRFETPPERFRRVAGRFTDLARAVPESRWESPSPCEGWTARDLVRHLTGWMPAVLARMEVPVPPVPSVDDDPAGAWAVLADTIQAALDNPTVAEREFEMEPLGRQSVAGAIGTIFFGDVFLHTWDLARATGQDESLDERIATEMLEGLRPMEQLLRDSGHYGPRVDVPEDADVQTRLLAFTGRSPGPARPPSPRST